MIRMLGQGWLYQVHHNKTQWLTRCERRRAVLIVCWITICVTAAVLLWLLK